MNELIKEILKDSIGNFSLPDFYFTGWKLVLVSVNILILAILFRKYIDLKKIVLISYLSLMVGVLSAMNIPFAIMGVFALFLLSKFIQGKERDEYYTIMAITSLFLGTDNVLITELFFLIIIAVFYFLNRVKSE